MSRVIACPSCGKSVNAPESCAGQRARCPKCRSVFRLPAAEQLAAAERPGEGDAETPLLVGEIIPEQPAAIAPVAPVRPVEVALPWYYKFLETYVNVALGLGIIATGFIGFFVVFAALQAVAERPAGTVQLVVFVTFVGVCLASALLSVAFAVALILLAVDAGRQLRAIEGRLRAKG